MSVNLVRPPDPVPPSLEAEVQKLTRQVRTILDLKVIPYYIQAQLGNEEYITVEDLADRWDKADDARTNGPNELKFEANSNDYTPEFSKLCAMRLYQAVKFAKQSGSSTVARCAEAGTPRG